MTYFGEIVEPSTRAFCDDYEENEEIEFPKLTWKWLIDEENQELVRTANTCKTFVIFEGTRITDFLNGVILKGKSPICQLENSKLALYECPTNENLIICICEEKDLNVFGMITEDLLKPWITEADNVYAISFQAAAISYKGIPDDMANDCFIRSITSKNNKSSAIYKQLECPNFITGLSASVATWRQFKNLSYACYIIYMDSIYFDMMSTEPILKMFTKLGIKCESKYMPKIINQSNLYM